MAAVEVPSASLAVIGGSGSLASGFPAGLHPDARQVEEELVFDTPWGDSPPISKSANGGLSPHGVSKTSSSST